MSASQAQAQAQSGAGMLALGSAATQINALLPSWSCKAVSVVNQAAATPLFLYAQQGAVSCMVHAHADQCLSLACAVAVAVAVCLALQVALVVLAACHRHRPKLSPVRPCCCS
jgi:hypothetical protein